MAPEDQFTAIADRLAQIPDPTTRAAAAMELFGKSGTQLLPLLANGAAGIEKLRAEARELGLTIDQDGADKAAAYADAMNRMKRAGEAVWMAIGAAVAPVLTDLADRLAGYAKAMGTWIREGLAGIIHGRGKGYAHCATLTRSASEDNSLRRPRLRFGFVLGHE